MYLCVSPWHALGFREQHQFWNKSNTQRKVDTKNKMVGPAWPAFPMSELVGLIIKQSTRPLTNAITNRAR